MQDSRHGYRGAAPMVLFRLKQWAKDSAVNSGLAQSRDFWTLSQRHFWLCLDCASPQLNFYGQLLKSALAWVVILTAPVPSETAAQAVLSALSSTRAW